MVVNLATVWRPFGEFVCFLGWYLPLWESVELGLEYGLSQSVSMSVFFAVFAVVVVLLYV